MVSLGYWSLRFKKYHWLVAWNVQTRSTLMQTLKTLPPCQPETYTPRGVSEAGRSDLCIRPGKWSTFISKCAEVIANESHNHGRVKVREGFWRSFSPNPPTAARSSTAGCSRSQHLGRSGAFPLLWAGSSNKPHRKEVSLHLLMNSLEFQFVPTGPCPVAGHY